MKARLRYRYIKLRDRNAKLCSELLKRVALVENGYPKKYSNLRGIPPRVRDELDEIVV